MEVISIIGAKGGLGKTCIAVNLAKYIACINLKTLLVDCDFNTNGATHFMKLNGLNIENNADFKSFEVIVKRSIGDEDEEELGKAEMKVNVAYPLFFVPSSVKRDFVNYHQYKEEELETRRQYIEKVMDQWREYYDVVILDHTGGYTDLVNFMLSFTSTILLVYQDNAIGLRTARNLFNKMALSNQNIIQCLNMIQPSDKHNREGVIKTCRGFEKDEEYNRAFSMGKFLKLDKETNAVLDDMTMTLFPDYYKDYKVAEKEKAIQKEKDELLRRWIIMVGFYCSFCIIFCLTLLLTINNYNIVAFIVSLIGMGIVGVVYGQFLSNEGKYFQKACDWYVNRLKTVIIPVIDKIINFLK